MTRASSSTAASDPYSNPALADYLDSFEGIIWPQPVEQPQERATRGTVRTWLHDAFASLGVLAPGLVLAFALAALAKWLSPWLGVRLFHQPPDKSPVSEIMLAILLGILIRNT